MMGIPLIKRLSGQIVALWRLLLLLDCGFMAIDFAVITSTQAQTISSCGCWKLLALEGSETQSCCQMGLKLSQRKGHLKIRGTLPRYTKEQLKAFKKTNPAFKERNVRYRYIPHKAKAERQRSYSSRRLRFYSTQALNACRNLKYQQPCNFIKKNGVAIDGKCWYQFVKPYKLYCK